jgi:hypothetical protein
VGSFEHGLAPGVFLTVREAASVCRVYEATIERAAEARRFPNAYRGDDGAWLIPVGDLVAAGYPPSALGSRAPLVAGRHEEDARPEMTAELDDLRRRAEAAEHLAAEQARHIAELRREREEILRERDELLRERDELLRERDEELWAERGDDPPTRPTRPSPDRR